MTKAAAPAAGTWLAIAFLRGENKVFKDRLITVVTHGPFVHTEVLIGRDGDTLRQARAYASFEGVSGFTPSKSFRVQRGEAWELLKFPLPPGGYEKAYASILQILATDLPYNVRDLWQCCVPVRIPFESDLDCERPETWKEMGGVYCSQAALLIVRRLSRLGTVSLTNEAAARVEATNSRGCSPNDLFRLLTAPRADEKKT